MKTLIYITLLILLTGCGNTKSYTEQDLKAFENLKALVTSQEFEIQSNFARPMASMAFMQVANTNILGPGNTASNISINNSSNHLTVKGDSISGHFPYFGEQQFGGSYPGTQHQGIEFNDIPKDYKVTVNENKHTVGINFKIDDQHRTNEHYNVFITLFPSKRSSIQINSTNRTSIEYSGSVSSIEEDKMAQN